MPPPAPAITWLNKRSVVQLDLPGPHTFASDPFGWSARFSADGVISVRTATGLLGSGLQVRAGDRLISRGEDLFLVPATLTTDL